MKLPFRKTELGAFILIALVLSAAIAAGAYAARRPLIADLAAARAATREAQATSAEAVTLAEQYADQVTGLEARLASLEASATASDDALGNIIEKLDALGFTVAVSDEGTVTITPPKPKVQPQSSVSSKPQAVVKVASYSGWSSAKVSWYGPGLYGNHTANGSTLTPTMVNFAHKTMAFGTCVTFRWNGKTVTAVCNDRGPYIAGRTFDLGPGTAKALGFSGVGTVEWRYAE